jgi:hypothetical protein
MKQLLLASLFAVLCWPLTGCKRQPTEGAPEIRKAYIGPELSTSDPTLTPEEAARRACEAQMREVLKQPEVPGAPAIEAERGVLLARTKAEPVLFKQRPEYSKEPVPLVLQGYRKMLGEGNPYGTVSRILEESEGFPQRARDALLKDGYLYAENPELAYALVSLVQPNQLFGHDRIWIQRGENVLHAEKRHGRFYYVDGPLEGERVRLLLFDRAGGGDEPPAPLHLDLRALRYRLHFDRMQIRRVTDDHVVANLHYGKWWVPTVLKTDGAHVSLDCEALAPNLRDEVEAYRAAGERRQRAVQTLRRAMLAELDEALPFDEPLHEYGFQLDGSLRTKWLAAYLHRRDKFAYNGDEYRVFDPKGRPLAPQVCIDFLTDTLERTSGTWYVPRGDTPHRQIGKLDFDTMGVDRQELRRVPGFVGFAKSHPDWFDVKDGEEIELGNRTAFFKYLGEHLDDFAPGDAVLIKGKTPWDPNHVHFHSFFIYESDPVTGMPLVLVGNAGRPSLRSWETEVRRTPKRMLLHRIRPKTEWLESIVGVEPLDFVPPLAAGPEAE